MAKENKNTKKTDDPRILSGEKAKERYELIKSKGLLLYECIVGSQSYGTNIATSDVDKKFIYIETLDNILNDNFSIQLNLTDDYVGYELGRYLELLGKQNPNIIELLHADEKFVEFCHPMFKEMIVAHKDEFLSNKVAFSFGSYAKTQIDKAQGTNKKFMNPMDGPRKSLYEFAWVPRKQGSISLKDWLEEGKINPKYIGLVAIDHMRYTYHVFYDGVNALKGTDSIYNGPVDIDGVQPKTSSIRIDEWPILIVQFNMDGFQKYCDDYKEYHEWLNKRNIHRFVENITVDKQYDCYLDSETEYLTESGWKKYDDISNDELLYTVNHSGDRILSPILDRIKKEYSGDIFTYKNAYTRFSVTPNHNLFLSKADRGSKLNYGVRRQMNEPKFISVEKYFVTKNSYYCFYNASNSYNQDYAINDDYLKLMGLFLSDGSLFFNSKKEPSQLSIGQSEGGKINDEIIASISYPHTKCISTSRNKNEYLYLFKKNIAMKIYDDCGHGSHQKSLPSWANKLSYRQLMILIDHMFLGDGYISTKGYKVYYTVSKNLADSMQAACALNGITTKIMGPYTNKTKWGTIILYHLYFPIKEFSINWLNKQKSSDKKRSGWTIRTVEREYISCFTTSSNLLITRNNNLVAIQGNTKNMMHCHRLLDMCTEILSGEGVKVYRPNREELLGIRHGNKTYQELVEEANIKIKKIDELYKTSKLPEECDKQFINELLLKFRKNFYNIQ